VPLPGYKGFFFLKEVHRWSACTLTSLKLIRMKVNQFNSPSADRTAKAAFISKLIVYLALALSFLMIIAKIRIAARNYHEKQQTISQKRNH
jgi:hypothetical protein